LRSILLTKQGWSRLDALEEDAASHSWSFNFPYRVLLFIGEQHPPASEATILRAFKDEKRDIRRFLDFLLELGHIRTETIDPVYGSGPWKWGKRRKFSGRENGRMEID
jgi:hypothetical protein